MKGVLSWLVRLGSLCRCKRFLSCFGCYSQLGTIYFFLTAHYFTLCGPITQQPGQAVVPDRLSPNMRLWLTLVFSKAEGGGVREESNLNAFATFSNPFYTSPPSFEFFCLFFIVSSQLLFLCLIYSMSIGLLSLVLLLCPPSPPPPGEVCVPSKAAGEGFSAKRSEVVKSNEKSTRAT
jgi:hypothetical protein